MENNNNKSYKFLLSAIGINFIMYIFVNIFFISHILNIAEKGIYTVSIFYIVAYAVMTPVYFASSVLLKKINKLHIFRLGILLKLIFVSSLILLNDYLVNNIVLVAFLLGVSDSVFWSAYNSMRNEIVSKKHMKSYTSYQAIIEFLIQIFVPVLLGFLIDLSTFEYILFAIFAVNLAQFILSLFIKNNQLSTQPYSLKIYRLKIKEKGFSNLFKKVFLNHFLKGITEIIPIIVVYITILTYKTNTSLGAITSIVSVASILTLTVFNKFYNSSKHNKIIIVFAIVSALGIVPLFFIINKVTLIVFNLIFSVFIILPNILTFINRSLISQKSGLTEYIVESNSVTEMFLNLGRVVGFSMLLLVGLSTNILALKTLLAVSMMLIVLLGVVVKLIENKMSKLD